MAVLSLLPKVFETIICEKLKNQVKPFFGGNQHGFLPKKSTVSNLLELSQRVARGLDAQHQTDVIYTDFAKAFDRVDHDILLKKMHRIGFDESLINFFVSYLRNRKQYVYINGYESKEFTAFSGVPQGSNLGPLLFLILIDDLQECIQHATCLLFADDLKLLMKICNSDDCIKLQLDLDAITAWADDSKLYFNIKKCVSMTYTRSKNPIEFIYKIKGDVLSSVKSIKDLGVVFDSKLTFSDHILQLSASCYKLLGFVIRSSKQFTKPEAMTSMFDCIIRSKLEYASAVWAPYQKKYVEMLEQIQKKFLRFLYMRIHGVYPQFMHHEDLLSETRYQSLQSRRSGALAVTAYKIISGLMDSPYLLECYKLFVPNNYCQGRHHDLIRIPHGRTDVLAQHSMTRGMVLLNSISLDIFNTNLEGFKRHVKKLL